MTDPDLLSKKLAFIQTCIEELRHLGKPDLIESDVREQRFVERTLQMAIQAALDVASHIVSDERLGEPDTNKELFGLLQRAGWIEETQAGSLQAMAGFRNVLVHGYQHVDAGRVRKILEENLDDLLKYVEAIRARLALP